MAVFSNLTPVSVIPVIIFQENGGLPRILYIDTHLGQIPGKNGETAMQEIKEHLPDTKLTRFAKRCAFKHQVVFVTKLVNTCNGPELATPIHYALLTRALKKPAILHAIPAAHIVNPDDVLVIEWQAHQEARAIATKLARMAVRAGVVAFTILNLVGI